MGRILSRYVLGEILKTFGAALFVLSVIFLIGSLYELVRNGYSFRQIAVVVPYILVYTLPFLLPVALLAGCSLAYGRLAADNEILPVMTGGLPAAALAVPALTLGVILAAVLYGLQGSLIPYGWLKKKDLVRSYLEQLTDLGEGEDKPISNGDSFHFFARRYSGSHVENVEVVYVPRGNGRDVLIQAPGAFLEAGRPTEIVAREGEIVRDRIESTVVLSLHDVAFTQFEAPKEGAAPLDPDALPPRGAPHHGHIDSVRIDIPFDWRLRDKTEFRSSAYLHEYLARLEAFQAFGAAPEAGEAGRARAATAPAGGLALPGGGPGATALGLARLAVLSPSPAAVAAARERVREVEGFLHARVTLALAPLFFALIGAAIPLRLQHNNRLVPFFVAFAVVSATFFLPWLTARSLVETPGGPPGALYWAAPALTLAVGAPLLARLWRR